MHEMIGIAARCWEENHPVAINKMVDKIRGQTQLLGGGRIDSWRGTSVWTSEMIQKATNE